MLAAAVAVAGLATSAAAEKPKSLVTILTAPEPQTQLMAMVLTMQSLKQGAEARVLLCGPAADLALKAAPASATAGQPPKNMSPQGLMQKIAEHPNASVEVCAIYLPGLGQGPEVLLDGVGVAKPGDMAAGILAADTTMSF
jgi:hypothetical protein